MTSSTGYPDRGGCGTGRSRSAKVATQNQEVPGSPAVRERGRARGRSVRGEYVEDAADDRPFARRATSSPSAWSRRSQAGLCATSEDQRAWPRRSTPKFWRYFRFPMSSCRLRSTRRSRRSRTPGGGRSERSRSSAPADCSGALVTVTVQESVFNELRIRDKAQIHLSPSQWIQRHDRSDVGKFGAYG